MSKKAEFIKSGEFDALCLDKAMEFRTWIQELCVTTPRQWLLGVRAFHFLSQEKALDDLPDEGDVTEKNADQEVGQGAEEEDSGQEKEP